MMPSMRYLDSHRHRQGCRALATIVVAGVLAGCSWLCPNPQCPNLPDSDALVPEAKHRVALTALDDKALNTTVCLVRSNDGPACEAAAQPPACDRRSEDEVRAGLRPLFDALRGYRLLSPTAAVKELREKLPKEGQPVVTTAVHDARRARDCTSKQGGACIAVRWNDIWLLLHADETGALTSADAFPSKNLCVADIDH